MQAISSRVPTHAEGTDIEILGWMSRAALELIGQAGIGYSFDPLTEDVQDAYAEAVKYFVCVSFLPPPLSGLKEHLHRLYSTLPDVLLLRQVSPYVEHLGPAWLRRWIMGNLPVPNIWRLVQITDTLYQHSLKIFRAKRAAIEADDDTDAKDIMIILRACSIFL